MKIINYNNQKIEIKTYNDNTIMWCSHWELVPSMAEDGILGSRFYQGLWAHTEYFIKK